MLEWGGGTGQEATRLWIDEARRDLTDWGGTGQHGTGRGTGSIGT